MSVNIGRGCKANTETGRRRTGMSLFLLSPLCGHHLRNSLTYRSWHVKAARNPLLVREIKMRCLIATTAASGSFPNVSRCLTVRSTLVIIDKNVHSMDTWATVVRPHFYREKCMNWTLCTGRRCLTKILPITSVIEEPIEALCSTPVDRKSAGA